MAKLLSPVVLAPRGVPSRRMAYASPLFAIVLTLFSGQTPQHILATDALALFDEFGFRDHLTPQRSNGLRSMVDRIRNDAREALASAA